MSAAVGFTAASGITPVFAQETTNAEVIKLYCRGLLI